MLSINYDTLHVIQDGADLGHVFDVIRNQPLLAAEIKGLFDVAWIARDEQHRSEKDALRAEKEKLKPE